MILKSVKLNNIRSYVDKEIKFPEGSILLAGDIGTGKSSILLAAEFALFGIRRGELSGSTLLRHGKKEGHVELKFDIDGKEIIVKRSLKRGKEAIAQSSGHIIINGKKFDITPVELKSKILELLGYPRELLTKSKSLIYRYTVYTAQEEMRQILADEKENRIDTLRKVFGIDRYKRISENSTVYIRNLKEKKKGMEGMVIDLEEKRKEKEDYNKKLEEVKGKIKDISPKIKLMKAKIGEKKNELKESEGKARFLDSLRNKLEINNAKIKEKKELIDRNSKSIEEIEKNTKELKKKIESIKVEPPKVKQEDIEKSIEIKEEIIRNKIIKNLELKEKLSSLKEKIKNLKKEIDEKGKLSEEIISKKEKFEKIREEVKGKEIIKRDIRDIEDEIKNIFAEIKRFEINKENSLGVKDKLAKIDKCPTCFQNVSEEHKKKIHEDASIKIKISENEIKKLNKVISEKEELSKKLKENLEKLLEKERLIEKISFELENLKNEFTLTRTSF